MIVPEVNHIRRRLDEVDSQMVRVLAERFKLVDALAEVKNAEPVRLKDPARESELLERVTTLGTEVGLSGTFVQRMFREVIDHSVRRRIWLTSGTIMVPSQAKQKRPAWHSKRAVACLVSTRASYPPLGFPAGVK